MSAERCRRALPAVLLLAVFLLSLCFQVTQPGFIPGETFANLYTGVRLFFADLFQLPLSLDRWDLIDAHPYYYETFVRLKSSLTTALSGMGICLAGAVFQTVFRNPLASPNILGVSAGVNLGNLVFILTFQTAALSSLNQRYLYCFACTFLILGVVLLVGKLAGFRARTVSIVDMIVVGSVLSQLTGVVATYLQYVLEGIDYSLLLVYQQLSLGIYVSPDTPALLLFFALILVGMVPVLLVRWRFNAAAFSDEDAALMGVHPGRLRGVGLVCGSVLAATALIFCGDVGMLSMAVPHICRYRSGADFRVLCYRSVCAGGVLMLLCRILSSLIYIQGVALPINFLISAAILPVFVVVLLRRKEAFAS